MQDKLQNSQNEFRDTLATVTKEGNRVWIYPKKPSGFYYTLRSLLSYLLLIFLFGAPFIKINGHPLMLFNIFERKFILFGVPFGPHDFHLFGLAMIATIVGIFLFTVVYGRLFCGWICPQTIFMELVFRKIEYFIEGDYKQQKKLDESPWSKKKFIKKSLKHVIFFLISFLIANTFLAYIVGSDRLFEIITSPPSENLTGFLAVLVFSFIFDFVFSKFREQACTMVCPYGRLQGVMLDNDSVVVAYDYKRGEPRGKIKKGEERNENGDCIDCGLCVDVCPTGIDIRNGTQLECVNCTACIDECNTVMSKINRPKNLIKYASINQIETGKKKIFTPRSIGYTVVLFILISAISYMAFTRNEMEFSLLRTPGVLFQEQPDNKISNLYDLKIVNKTFDTLNASMKLSNLAGEIKIIGMDLKIPPHEVKEGKVLIILDNDSIKTINTPIEISVINNGKTFDIVKTSFLGNFKKGKFKNEN